MGEVVKFPPPQPEHSYVSPYLLRPLRRKEEVEGARPRPADEKSEDQTESKTPPDGAPARTTE